MWIFRKTWI